MGSKPALLFAKMATAPATRSDRDWATSAKPSVSGSFAEAEADP